MSKYIGAQTQILKWIQVCISIENALQFNCGSSLSIKCIGSKVILQSVNQNPAKFDNKNIPTDRTSLELI